MLTDQEEQAKRRRVLRNDARVRDQSRNGDTSSYIDHYSPEMGGRHHALPTTVAAPSEEKRAAEGRGAEVMSDDDNTASTNYHRRLAEEMARA